MSLQKLLQNAIGYRINLKLQSVSIHEEHSISTCDDILICLYDDKKNLELFLIKDDFGDFEDEIDRKVDQQTNSEETVDYKMDTKYAITIEKTNLEFYQKQQISLSNSYFEIIGVEVYRRKTGNNKSGYDELNKAMNLSPELYILNFKRGELIIYYSCFGPKKYFFYNRKSFLNHIYEFGNLSLNDFDIIL